MKFNLIFSLCSLFLIFLFSSVFAEDIDLSDEATAKELLLGKILNCQMDETNYHGSEVIHVREIKGKKFTGFSDLWCWQKGTTYKGKFKGNSLKWSQQEHSACYCRTGNLNFYKADDGNLNAEGNYVVGCGVNPTFLGKIKCEVIEQDE